MLMLLRLQFSEISLEPSRSDRLKAKPSGRYAALTPSARHGAELAMR
jgi:hypothetical protein